jgi:hypothetical protein
MRKRDKIVRVAHKAKENLLYLPNIVVGKMKDYFHGEPNQNDGLLWEKEKHIRIRCFHALNSPEIARIYMSGQKDVLKEFNVTGVTSAKNNTWENSNTYIFIAEDVNTGEIGAGMRLDVADAIHKLPLEMALESKVPDLALRIHRFDNVIAEACGWWVKKTFSERRIPKQLLLASIAIAPKLRIPYILGFPHAMTKKITDSLGFTNVRNLGNNDASFYYPNEKYLSTVVELNAQTLENVPDHEKEKIISLRTNPKQTFELKNGDYQTIFDFDLRLY